MPRTSTLLVLALSLACLAGCAGPEPLPLPPPPAEASRRPALAIAPIVSAYEASADRSRRDLETTLHLDVTCTTCGEDLETVVGSTRCPECENDPLRPAFSRPYRPRTETEPVRARAAALLEQRGAFERVVLLPADDPRPAGLAPGQLRAAWRETARAKGARFLLEPTLEDARVELIEKNGWHWFKVLDLIVSSILIFPGVDPLNWVIPGEDYGVVQALAWRVTDLETDTPVAEGRLQRVTRASFNDFGPGPSRGFFIVGFIRAPGCLDEEDWVDIHAQLAEVAAEDLAAAVVLAAEEGARPR